MMYHDDDNVSCYRVFFYTNMR